MTKFFLCLALLSANAFAVKDFEVFDGQYYNGQFYPLVDNIEWGEADHELPHMEFHIHQKDKAVGISVISGAKAGKPVLWVMYDLAYRAEHVCRRVLAPAQFKEGQKVYAYRDNSDPDYDNVMFYSQPLAQKGAKALPEYTMPPYERCPDENADNMPMPEGSKPSAVPAGTTPTRAAGPVPDLKGPSPASVMPARKGGLPVDYDNTAVPFSF